MSDPTWGIVMTAREPAQLVLANIGWHLHTGASEIHLYLDDPEDPVAADVAAVPQVHVTLCDTDHWGGRKKGRPDQQTRRQVFNCDHAMARAGVDWLVHLDADEFLVQHTSMAAEMAWLRPHDSELHFPVCERFYTEPPTHLFDGVLRHATTGRRDLPKDLFGDLDRYFKAGMTGHTAGKSAAPTDSDFRLGVHSAYRGKRDAAHKAERHVSRSTRLYHFDGLTPLHWLIKLGRYAKSREQGFFPPGRTAQLDDLVAVRGDAAKILGFHNKIRMMDQATVDLMNRHDLLEPTGFDPAPAIKDVFGQLPDLSVAQFDADLAARFPDLVAYVMEKDDHV